MATNTVDVLVRLRTQLLGLTGALGGIASISQLIDNIVEAQEATAQLNAAFKATGQGLGLSRQKLDELASSLQQTTTFSDDLVKNAEAVLLTFNKVRGEGFERTIKAAADLSTRFGTDLVSSTKLLGKALQDPINGLTQLRRAGVTFTGAQKELIESFVASGDRAKAQGVILAEVEKRFKGSAEAARNTLGGALKGLKNAFGDALEGTEKGTSAAVKAINALSKAFSDPKLKEGFDLLIEFGANTSAKLITDFTNLVPPINKLSEALRNLGKELPSVKGLGDSFNAAFNPLGNAVEKAPSFIDFLTSIVDKTREASEAFRQFARDKEIALLERKLEGTEGRDDFFTLENRKRLARLQSERDREKNRGGPSTRGGTAGRTSGIAPTLKEEAEELDRVSEVIITLQKRNKDTNAKVLEELNEDTKTAAEKQISEFNRIKASLEALRDLGEENGGISQKVFDERFDEAFDNFLPEIDLQEIRSRFKVIEKQADETAAIVRGAFEQAGASIQSTLSDAIQSGKLSFKSLLDVAKKTVADILAAIIVSGIRKALIAQLASAGGTGGGKSGFLGSVAKLFLGSKSGGGFASTPFVAGEDGPEIIDPRGSGVRVFNRRQLQFASRGSGGTNVFSPQTTVQIIERENPEKMKQEILQIQALIDARNQEKFINRLAKNGVVVR